MFPPEIRTDARSLLTGLLDRNPKTRLGSGPRGAADIKDHAFFMKALGTLSPRATLVTSADARTLR